MINSGEGWAGEEVDLLVILCCAAAGMQDKASLNSSVHYISVFRGGPDRGHKICLKIYSKKYFFGQT